MSTDGTVTVHSVHQENAVMSSHPMTRTHRRATSELMTHRRCLCDVISGWLGGVQNVEHLMKGFQNAGCSLERLQKLESLMKAFQNVGCWFKGFWMVGCLLLGFKKVQCLLEVFQNTNYYRIFAGGVLQCLLERLQKVEFFDGRILECGMLVEKVLEGLLEKFYNRD